LEINTLDKQTEIPLAQFSRPERYQIAFIRSHANNFRARLAVSAPLTFLAETARLQ